MSWNTGAKDAGGGDYFGPRVGDTVRVQLAGMYAFVEKDFGDPTPAQMCEIPAHDLDNPTDDGAARTLSMGKRRSQPLLAMCGDLEAQGLDPLSRAIEIECYGIKHPTMAGKTIGKLRCKDLGPATEHGGSSRWNGGAEVADPVASAVSAMADAATEDELRTVFGLAWRSHTDEAARVKLKASYNDAKARLAPAAAVEDIPF